MALKNIPSQPLALYDTLNCLKQLKSDNLPVPSFIVDYIAGLKIPNALKEYEISKQFLLSYAGSQETFNAYRREVERFLQWSWLILKKSIKNISRSDFREYLDFIHQPPKSWINNKNVSRFIYKDSKDSEKFFNLQWRPFTVKISKINHWAGKSPDKENYQLKPRSLSALFAVLSTFFTYLQQEDYVSVNPVTLIRQKNQIIQRQQTKRITRKLSELQWQTVIDIAEQMADKDNRYERILFIMAAFYLLGLRISELSETPGRIPVMGDFAPDKQGLWWFTTIGKGNKMREVAVPDAMLEILKRYRLSRQLSALPAREEASPLINKERGRGGLGPRQIRLLVQKCFNQAVNKLNEINKLDEAHDLSAATVHWLRHTAISADILERPREHVRDDVGHENAATMDRYIDTDRLSRHASAKNKLLKPLRVHPHCAPVKL